MAINGPDWDPISVQSHDGELAKAGLIRTQYVHFLRGSTYRGSSFTT